MKAIINVLLTIIAIPFAVIAGVLIGLVMPFVLFADVFEKIWGFADASTNN